MEKNECHCFVHHAITEQHRALVSKDLAYYRRIGDATGIMVAMAQLTDPCPARGASNTQITSAK